MWCIEAPRCPAVQIAGQRSSSFVTITNVVFDCVDATKIASAVSIVSTSFWPRRTKISRSLASHVTTGQLRLPTQGPRTDIKHRSGIEQPGYGGAVLCKRATPRCERNVFSISCSGLINRLRARSTTALMRRCSPCSAKRKTFGNSWEISDRSFSARVVGRSCSYHPP